MKVYLATLVLFLLAFSGLGAGLLLKRRGLKGGCSPPSSSGRDCSCKSEITPKRQSKIEPPGEEEEHR
jgi:hypothetical protein